ncbi:MAG TPA: polysaccharide deacetylase family protein [Humidesulfovibrio sp.]|uniref:polysaccharide deacetylase family protein n=1 Tax=Humidesulfovibrio sp. TaxID=2910988 RepID=UPI002BCF8E38|nr:polysaccharide deacetylase family protein [Humidesulfovibrio sp.]HWR04730.1 polysaccharide deacetylase family protein [Humidesulfovibrio sp.]
MRRPGSLICLALLLCLCLPAPGHGQDILDAPGIRRMEARDNACAITFDDGPGKYTDALLDILKAHHVRATFFVLGGNAVRHRQTLLRMAAEGHEIANHSYDHPDFRHLSPERQRDEIERTEQVLRGLGITPRFFRPPYGLYDADTVRLAEQEHMVLALWSVDSQDWKYRKLSELEARVLPGKGEKAEGVFLFHDIHQTTVNAMGDVLDKLAADGCRFVTLGQWTEELSQRAAEPGAGGAGKTKQ